MRNFSFQKVCFINDYLYFCSVSSSRASLQCLNMLDFFVYRLWQRENSEKNAWCHHARVWNKVNKIIPNDMRGMTRLWITIPADKRRIYYNMCIIKYFLDIISPNNDMLDKMHNLFGNFPEIDLAALGFPVGWEQEPLWIQANTSIL